jgi:hypothetical protein
MSPLIAAWFMLVSCLYYSSTWRWRKHGPPNLGCLSTDYMGLSKKIEPFINTAVGTWNPTNTDVIHENRLRSCWLSDNASALCSPQSLHAEFNSERLYQCPYNKIYFPGYTFCTPYWFLILTYVYTRISHVRLGTKLRPALSKDKHSETSIIRTK